MIQQIKEYHYGKTKDGKPIDLSKTRDQILYGDPQQVCKGIVTCIYASVDIIRESQKRKCNLIICHESLFWNHRYHRIIKYQK